MSNFSNLHSEIRASKESAPTLIVNGIALHSTYNPLREAEKTVSELQIEKGDLIVVVENGFGYLPLQIAETFSQAQMLVIIPEPRLLPFSNDSADDWRKRLPATARVLTPFEEKEFAECLNCFRSSQIKLLIPPPLEKLFLKTVSRLRSLVAYHRDIEVTNEATLKKYGKRFESNLRRNELLFLNGKAQTVNALKGIARSQTLLIIAAGPTLDAHIEEIKAKRNGFLLIAVDTALVLLQKQKITPDFVITGDPQFFNAMHLMFAQKNDLKLLAPFSTYFLNSKQSWKEIYFYATRFPTEKAFAEKQNAAIFGSGGTVAATAVEAARWMGAKKIVLIGVDLGYPGGQTHAKGSFFEEKTLNGAGRLHPFETASFRLLHAAIATETVDGNGKRLISDRRMDLYRNWFAEYAGECVRIDRRGSRIASISTQDFLFE